jgi:predicted ThiF/HesA family dinucleotide-utilizing enzyme
MMNDESSECNNFVRRKLTFVFGHSSLVSEVAMTFFLHEARYRDLTPAAHQLVTICGAGALGANLTETLARMGLRRLRVIDCDRIEEHNLSTQPWIQQDVGAAKTRVLANALYRAVGTRVETQQVELTPSNAEALLSGSVLVVDAFDNLPSRIAVSDATTTLGIPCLHIALGSEGDYGCGLWDNAYISGAYASSAVRTQPALDTCSYPLTRPLGLLVAAAAAEVLVGYLTDGRPRNFECTLRDIRLSTT